MARLIVTVFSEDTTVAPVIGSPTATLCLLLMPMACQLRHLERPISRWIG